MKDFVVISDTHLHPWTAFARGDGVENSRLRSTLRVLRASLETARGKDIPWLFPGDLIHTAGYAYHVVLSQITALFQEFEDVPKVAVWGNHDARGIGSTITIDETIFGALRKTVGGLWVLDPSTDPVVELQGVRIVGAGYQPRVDLLTLPEPGDIGLFHQTVRGSLAPNGFALEEGVERERLLETARVSLVGHIHHPQQIDAPDGRAILIPGSPEHHNFGDKGEHGWWILSLPDDDGTNPTVEFVPGGSPEFRTVDTPDDIDEGGIHFYRIRTVPKGTELSANSTALAPAPTTVEARGILRDASGTDEILQAWMAEAPPEDGIASGEVLRVGRSLLEAQDPTRLRDYRLTSLRLEDFCSYREADLTVEEGVWLVTGSGRDYPSNGAGKSTLVGESLYWLLFGKTTKGLSAGEEIRWGASSCLVRGTFRGPNGEAMTVTRSRGSSHELSVEVGDEVWSAESVNAMTTKLGRFFGVTPEIFQNLGYFSQEKLLLFSSATDGDRKEVLADLIGLSAYQEAATAAGAEVSRIGGTLLSLQSRIETLREEHESEGDRAAELRMKVAEWDEEHEAEKAAAEARVEEARATFRRITEETKTRADRILARLQDQYRARRLARVPDVDAVADELSTTMGAEAVRRLAVAREAVETKRADLPALSATLDRREEFTALRDRLETDEAAKVSELAEHRLTVQRLEGRVSLAERAVQEADRNLRRIRDAADAGTCPTCGQATAAEQMAEEREAVEAAAGKAETELVEARAARDAALPRTAEIEKARDDLLEKKVRVLTVLRRIDDYRTRLSDLQELERRAEAAEAEVARVRSVAEEKARGIVQGKQTDVLRRVNHHAARIHAIVKRWNDRAGEAMRRAEDTLSAVDGKENPHQGTLTSSEERLGSLSLRIRDTETELSDVRGRVGVYEYWKSGFGKQGIQSLLVEEVAHLFNEERSRIFPVLTGGVYDVQFSTLSETKSGERRERTEFRIYQHGKPIPYGATSGGQRRRIDLGVMLTLVMSVARWMRVPGLFGVLTLDEVFGYLDDSGAEGLLAALDEVREVIPTIYAVTHDTHLRSMFPSVLRVEQDENGVSCISGVESS